MGSKILFLTTAHKHDDDRIFYHQAKELVRSGFQVKVSSLSSDFQGIIENIEIESYNIVYQQNVPAKKKVLEKICEDFQPKVIICSEPLAVIAAKNYSKKNKATIVYDVTEWYPSMRMLEPYSLPFKVVHGLKFFLIQLYAGFLSNHFIFGEKSKTFPLATFFPYKKSIMLSYFPDDAYIHQHINKLEDKKIKLCYTGVFSKEKGIENFFEAVDFLIKKRKDLEVSILLIGGSRQKKDEDYFLELLEKYQFEALEIKKPVDFEKFTDHFADADLCFDLRTHHFENDHCLPIKIFYYAAAGKPVIYTNLKATREFVDVSKFGHLVDPEDAQKIAALIENYVDHPDLYTLHAENARKIYEEKFNWNLIRTHFVEFIKQASK